jgi:hypothetical protein
MIETIQSRKCQSRKVSMELLEKFSVLKIEPVLPNEYLPLNLHIDKYLKSIEEQYKMKRNHLTHHKINSLYRAKMVDWITEVLTAFKCSD